MSRIAWEYGVGPKPEGRYLSAEVCLNGHVITGAIEDEPEKTSKFCGECGAATIHSCPKCSAGLQGDHVYGNTVTWMIAPKGYCGSCGAAFPWTTTKIAAAKEHAGEIEGLDAAERAKLQEAIEDLATGGPRTELGASRFKRLMEKVGKPAASGLYKLVLDVVTEAAKKTITQQLPW